MWASQEEVCELGKPQHKVIILRVYSSPTHFLPRCGTREASQVALIRAFPGLDFGGLKNEATCRGHPIKTTGKVPGLVAAVGDWTGWGSLFLVSFWSPWLLALLVASINRPIMMAKRH